MIVAVQDRRVDPLTAVERLIERGDGATMRRPTLADIRGSPRDARGASRARRRSPRPSRCRASSAARCSSRPRTCSGRARSRSAGPANRIASLDERERAAGVVTASAGNHGQAVAWAARRAGDRGHDLRPAGGADGEGGRGARLRRAVELAGETFDDAVEAARRARADERAPRSSTPSTIRSSSPGQGTLGLELAEQLPRRAGHGRHPGRRRRARGAGSRSRCAALRPELRLVGVQAAACAPYAGLTPTRARRSPTASPSSTRER